jgi:hypothetical protein
MGRPIKQLHIGNRNPDGAGGEQVASVTTAAGNSSGFTTLDALTIGAPDLPEGVQAVGHVVSAAGAIDSAVITTAGSGYTSAPTVTAVTGGTQGTATLTAVLTTGTANSIQCTAYVTSLNVAGDIVSQKGSKTYKVTTSEGTLECTLVAAVPTAVGEMQITATDSAAGTYWVTKLTNRTVVLTRNTGTEFAEGSKQKWADTAVLNESVSITA